MTTPHKFWETPMVLAPAQQRAYDFIVEELCAGRRVPGGRVIARHLGWKSHGAGNDVLASLQRKHRLIYWKSTGPVRFVVNQG